MTSKLSFPEILMATTSTITRYESGIFRTVYYAGWIHGFLKSKQETAVTDGRSILNKTAIQRHRLLSDEQRAVVSQSTNPDSLSIWTLEIARSPAPKVVLSSFTTDGDKTLFEMDAEQAWAADYLPKVFHEADDAGRSEGKRIGRLSAMRNILSRLPEHEAPFQTKLSSRLVKYCDDFSELSDRLESALSIDLASLSR